MNALPCPATLAPTSGQTDGPDAARTAGRPDAARTPLTASEHRAVLAELAQLRRQLEAARLNSLVPE